MSGRLVGSNMATAVKTISAGTMGKNLGRSTDILFQQNNPQAFSAASHKHFPPLFSQKVEPVYQPTIAKLCPRDVRHFKEEQSETKESYQHHPLPQITHTPQRILHDSNIKIEKDPREILFRTNYAREFQPKRCERRSPFFEEIVSKQEEWFQSTGSTTKATYTPHHIYPAIKVKPEPTEFSPFRGDKRFNGFVSDYSMNFQGDQSTPAQSTKNHNISVAMGDPVKIDDRETSYNGSFRWPPVCRPPEVKEHPKLILGSCSNSWLSTSQEDFRPPKHCPVAQIQMDRNSSCIPGGDTDESRNKERMSVTTNRVSFSDPTPKERPVYVSRHGLRSKSHVQLGVPCLSGRYYTTTANEHYSKRDGERAKPAVFLPSSILRGPDYGLSRSVTQSDYVPQQISKPPPCVSLHKSNNWFPQVDKCFSTTYTEEYIPKRLAQQQPIHSRLANRMKIKC